MDQTNELSHVIPPRTANQRHTSPGKPRSKILQAGCGRKSRFHVECSQLIRPFSSGDSSILSEFLPITPCVLAPWIIIPLDSHWPHHVEGRLIEDELNRVQRVLDEIELSREIRFVLVAVHHPPHFNCAAPNCTLAEPEALLKLTRHDAVRLLISGHVHDDYAHQVGTTLFSTCPSTCIGFDHNPAGHRTTTLPSGAIIYDLHDDGSVSRRAVYAQK